MRSKFIAAIAAVGMSLAGWSATCTVSYAADANQVESSAGRFTATGILRKEGMLKNGTPRYALFENGQLTTHVVPSTGLDLATLVEQRVTVSARAVSYRDEAAPYVLADRVEPTTAEYPRTPVMPAAYESNALPAANAVASRRAIQSQPVGPLPGASAAALASPIGGPGTIRQASATEYIDLPPGIPYGAPDNSLITAPPYDVAGPAVPCPSCGVAADCGGQNCNSGCPCGIDGYTWVRAEYLSWWTKGLELPPLVTTGTNQVASQAGVLAQPGTSVLLGNQEVIDGQRNGGRFKAGYWRDQSRFVGLEGEYLFLSNQDFGFAQTSNGTPILARPFTNVLLGGAQDSELVAFPNIVSGTVTAGADSTFNSAGLRFRINACCHNAGSGACGQCLPCLVPSGMRFDWLAGYRYLRLDENIFIREQLASGLAGTQTNFDLQDQFDAQNTFHGGELGMLLELNRGPWLLELIGKAALGNTHREMRITGSTTTTAGGIALTEPGGLLALPSNIGNYESDEFSVVPEFSATIGYALTYRLRLTFGYTFIHWNNVIRAGDQIDLNVNPNLLPPATANPGQQSPAFAFMDTDFWAQGMNFGVDYRW